MGFRDDAVSTRGLSVGFVWGSPTIPIPHGRYTLHVGMTKSIVQVGQFVLLTISFCQVEVNVGVACTTINSIGVVNVYVGYKTSIWDRVLSTRVFAVDCKIDCVMTMFGHVVVCWESSVCFSISFEN